MIWAKEETLSRDEMSALQLKRLKDTVERIYGKQEPYRKKMDELGLLPGDIKTLEDLKKLPFTTKQDFRDHYPFGLFCVPRKEIVRIHASSGTVSYTHLRMQRTERILEISVEHEKNVFGGLDIHLKKIEKNLNVEVVVRNGSIIICGEEKNCNRAVRTFTELIELSKRGNEITEQNVNCLLYTSKTDVSSL